MRLFSMFCGVFLFAPLAVAQTALHHYGNMRLHGEAHLGLHTSFINDAPFEQKEGLVGFYGANILGVGGTFAPLFQDVEILRDAPVFVDVAFSVSNNLNFLQGDFETDRSLADRYITLLQNAFTVGESNVSKVNGYVTAVNKQRMVFPVGDALQYRSLTLEGEVFPFAKCAYFREDPNGPSTFPPFRTDLKPRSIRAISTSEFWRLEGSSTGQVTLSWNAESNLASLSEGDSPIVLIGWSKSTESWIAIGAESTAGDLENGFLVSPPFVPDQFEILTFASLAEPEEVLTLDNYYLSPNGDGINDALVIEELAESPNNNLQVYDRRGLKVFEMENYTDEFRGFSNLDNLVINAEKGLPEGVYFYLVKMYDLDLEFQGFLVLDR
jgi:gliding motility-associated-like protein